MEVTNVKKVIKISELPEGTYPGKMSAYTASFEINGEKYVCETNIGVRGLNIPCSVVVANEKIIINQC